MRPLPVGLIFRAKIGARSGVSEGVVVGKDSSVGVGVNVVAIKLSPRKSTETIPP